MTLYCTHQAHKNVSKSGGKKNSDEVTPPLRFSKLKIFVEFQNYIFLNLDILKTFLISKIDLHSPGTQKIKKSSILLVKKIGRKCFFCAFSWYFDFSVTKMKLDIVLNVLNEFVKGFYPNRPVSAKIRILAYFFS